VSGAAWHYRQAEALLAAAETAMDAAHPDKIAAGVAFVRADRLVARARTHTALASVAVQARSAYVAGELGADDEEAFRAAGVL
jgi:hypothetical protein